MNFVKFNEEVFYTDDRVVKISQVEINQLKQLALQATRQRSRLCTHKDVNDSLHEMLIVHERDTYVRPHKHLDKSESFHVIEGELDVALFNDEGELLDVIKMADYGSGKVFYYRLTGPIFHTVLIRSDVAVFHETTNGPFRREDTIFAEWAPSEGDTDAVRQFIVNLERQLTKFRGR